MLNWVTDWLQMLTKIETEIDFHPWNAKSVEMNQWIQFTSSFVIFFCFLFDIPHQDVAAEKGGQMKIICVMRGGNFVLEKKPTNEKVESPFECHRKAPLTQFSQTIAKQLFISFLSCSYLEFLSWRGGWRASNVSETHTHRRCLWEKWKIVKKNEVGGWLWMWCVRIEIEWWRWQRDMWPNPIESFPLEDLLPSYSLPPHLHCSLLICIIKHFGSTEQA